MNDKEKCDCLITLTVNSTKVSNVIGFHHDLDTLQLDSLH